MPRDSLIGWSDHGARWQAPQYASWLSVDRPILAPFADAIAAFWDRHNHQVNRQKLNLSHDPDGNATNPVTGAMGFAAGGVLGATTQTGISLYRGEPTSLRTIGAPTLSGAIAGRSCGTSLLMAAGGAATGSAIGGMASRAIAGDRITANCVDLGVGVGVGAVSFGLAKSTSRISGFMTRQAAMALPAKLAQIHAILANSASLQALIDRVILSSRLPAKKTARISTGVHSIAKKHGHGPSPGQINNYANTKPTQENAKIIFCTRINDHEDISVNPINAHTWSGDRRIWLETKGLTFKRFSERRVS